MAAPGGVAARLSPAAVHSPLLAAPLESLRPQPPSPPPFLGSQPQDSVWTDAWGQPKNPGLAVAEAFLGNFLPWLFNETVPSRQELLISQVSPRSWWRNLRQGWEWDDNAFQVNHFAHPFQGNIYFNAGRSNGFGYWGSLLFATAGSFHWECCGETHFMSINDWVNTSLGGAAVGEVLYRTSSRILDNEARGTERVLREVGAFLLNPSRGATRLLTGTAGRVYENPRDPLDHRPPVGGTELVLGLRGATSIRRARGGELREGLDTHGYIDAEVRSGTLSDIDRGKPFDVHSLKAQFNFIRGRALGEFAIQGNLWHRPLARRDSVAATLVLVQDFEYENNPAFEQGGQGVSLLYARRSALSGRDVLTWHAGPTWTILGGVKSELAFLAEVEGIRERFREYDFGIGPGLRAGYTWQRDGRTVLQMSYRGRLLATLNGSSGKDFGSDHLIQIVRARAILPWRIAGLGVGADYELFHRRSDFDIDDIGVVNQRTGIWQTFLSWSPGR
jgi:hypothetical protein